MKEERVGDVVLLRHKSPKQREVHLISDALIPLQVPCPSTGQRQSERISTTAEHHKFVKTRQTVTLNIAMQWSFGTAIAIAKFTLFQTVKHGSTWAGVVTHFFTRHQEDETKVVCLLIKFIKSLSSNS